MIRCGPEEKKEHNRNLCVGNGEGMHRRTEDEMNEELEVRESSLSYVIGSMNNNWTRKSGYNDPCGKGSGMMIKYGIARYVMGRRRGDARTR